MGGVDTAAYFTHPTLLPPKTLRLVLPAFRIKDTIGSEYWHHVRTADPATNAAVVGGDQTA